MLRQGDFQIGDEVRTIQPIPSIDDQQMLPAGSVGQIRHVWQSDQKAPLYDVEMTSIDRADVPHGLATDQALSLIERWIPRSRNPAAYETIATVDLSRQPALYETLQQFISSSSDLPQLHAADLWTLYQDILNGRPIEQVSDAELAVLGLIQELRQQKATQAIFKVFVS